MCDTFVALGNHTEDSSVIFGKNSDREPNEAQVLEYHPPSKNSGKDPGKVKCTYLTIPQSRETFGVLLCRPFWMWGAEMGVNDRGVAIGNEAVFTKMPYNRNGGLTGMDLLRLALERSSGAEKGLETIIALLSDYGQGGVCGYRDKKMVYHNSFIIADSREAWVLETAGHLWAALRVKGAYSISNGLTIGSEFDLSHPRLIDTARKKGWLKKGRDFSFAECYSDSIYTTFSGCRRRRMQSGGKLGDYKGAMNARKAMEILRLHGDEPYYPDSHFIMNSVCAHGANGLTRNSQTTGSFIASLKPEDMTLWATAASAPCTGIFKPLWFEGNVLPDLGPVPGGEYNPASPWWRHELLHRIVLQDYPEKISAYREERDMLEASFIKKAEEAQSGGRFGVTEEAFGESSKAIDRWLELASSRPVRKKPGFFFRRYWKRLNREAGITDKVN